VKLCTAAQSQYDPVIVSDGAGGAVVAWADNRGPSGDIYAQRVDADGDTLWLGDGVPLCTATGGQGGASIVSDDEGSAIVAWQDNRGPGGFNIYVQRVDAAGNTLWAEDGVALCIATGDQQSPTLTLAGAGSAIVTWQDQRGGYSDIYAQRVTRLGNPGTDPVPISTLAVVVAATALASLGFGVLRRKLRHG
jgi:hypothetical protein